MNITHDSEWIVNTIRPLKKCLEELKLGRSSEDKKIIDKFIEQLKEKK